MCYQFAECSPIEARVTDSSALFMPVECSQMVAGGGGEGDVAVCTCALSNTVRNIVVLYFIALILKCISKY